MDRMFEMENWELFTGLDDLQLVSGVDKSRLGLLIAKELVDNALDNAGSCKIGEMGNNGFYVEDDGDGIDVGMIPKLFSINRPMVSSKYLRLPTRGALGNGLRVVCGTVVATNGELYVSTKGKKFKVNQLKDGTSDIQEIGEYKDKGTRVEVFLGDIIKPDLRWAKDAMRFSGGNFYKGKTSAYWYTSEDFFRLTQAHTGKLSYLINMFDGCSGSKSGKILEGFKYRDSNTLSEDESNELLYKIKEYSKPVNANRLGYIGQIDGYSYSRTAAEFSRIDSKEIINATIPFVVEAWVSSSHEQREFKILVNKSPIIEDVLLLEVGEGKNYISCCGIDFDDLNIGRTSFIINIITPYMPILSHGKKPNLLEFESEILGTLKRAVRQAKKQTRQKVEKKPSLKSVIVENIEIAINKVSGNHKYRFGQRQLFYTVRDIVDGLIKREVKYDYFCKLITEYESAHGDIKNMYRDDRGTIYHPHLGTRLPIGTISVEQYERPKWIFNKALYIEKEGFFDVLIDNKLPEKYDMALLTSKGYASRAVKDLLDYLGEDTEEEITIFCIHDADAAGTMIYETLQNETKARPERKVKIINLGLDPAEALEMGLKPETAPGKGMKPVADYIKPEWTSWLQNNRIELNAMTTPVFLEWLDTKLQLYDRGKVVPPGEILGDTLFDKVRISVGKEIMDEILAQNNYENRVNNLCYQIEKLERQNLSQIKNDVIHRLEVNKTLSWNYVICDMVKGIINRFLKIDNV